MIQYLYCSNKTVMLLADTTERAHVTQKLLVQRSLFMPAGIYLMVQQLTCDFL